VVGWRLFVSPRRRAKPVWLFTLPALTQRKVTLRLPLRRRMLWWLLAVCTLHVLWIMYTEGWRLFDALWFTATTLTTVGYGDKFPVTDSGKTGTVVLMYAGGIFVLANAISAWSEFKAGQRLAKLTGKWRWRMPQGYLLIVSPLGNETADYYVRLVHEIRAAPEWAGVPIQIMSPTLTDLPDVLHSDQVVHRVGTGLTSELAGQLDATHAVVVLGDSRNPHSDALVFDLVSRIPHGHHVVAEVVDDGSRDRFKRAGADVMVRPMRGYPEMLARAVTTPGCERIIEEMFSGAGQTVVAVELGKGLPVDCSKVRAKLEAAQLGTLLALEQQGNMLISPYGVVAAERAFVLAHGTASKQAMRAAFVR
jgi:voltage-gated potassium channel